jgi:serine/threonine-protein phosphatase 2A regulatory subunit A
MRTDEVHLKVNAIHRLKTVILSIGVEETSKRMIDYLDGLIKAPEDDEVLFAIAEEMGKCWELIPDKTLFLPLLEKLCMADETVVREQAYQSMSCISGSLSD